MTYTVWAKHEFGEPVNLGTFDEWGDAETRRIKAANLPEFYNETHVNDNSYSIVPGFMAKFLKKYERHNQGVK